MRGLRASKRATAIFAEATSVSVRTISTSPGARLADKCDEAARVCFDFARYAPESLVNLRMFELVKAGVVRLPFGTRDVIPWYLERAEKWQRLARKFRGQP